MADSRAGGSLPTALKKPGGAITTAACMAGLVQVIDSSYRTAGHAQRRRPGGRLSVTRMAGAMSSANGPCLAGPVLQRSVEDDSTQTCSVQT